MGAVTTTGPNESGDDDKGVLMYTKHHVVESAFAGSQIRPHVSYSHTDPVQGDMWLIECTGCGGNGYDIEVDDWSVCTSCDGLGEYGPMPEQEVRDWFGA